MTVLPFGKSSVISGVDARPRPGARRDDGGDDHPLRLRHRHLQPDQLRQPLDDRRQHRPRLPRVLGPRVNTLIASGLVLFAITLVTNMIAARDHRPQKSSRMEAQGPTPAIGRAATPARCSAAAAAAPARAGRLRRSSAARRSLVAAVLLALGAASASSLAWSSSRAIVSRSRITYAWSRAVEGQRAGDRTG